MLKNLSGSSGPSLDLSLAPSEKQRKEAQYFATETSIQLWNGLFPWENNDKHTHLASPSPWLEIQLSFFILSKTYMEISPQIVSRWSSSSSHDYSCFWVTIQPMKSTLPLQADPKASEISRCLSLCSSQGELPSASSCLSYTGTCSISLTWMYHIRTSKRKR